ncbi:MAG: tail fiber protein [Caudoviricetes sp.]|nr:MAG: tail fiber protein [Caudoviricetes sp.]
MAQSSNVKKTPLKVDASASDVLLTPSQPVLLFLGVTTAARTDPAITISQNFRVPKGTGCFVAAHDEHSVVIASPLGVVATPAALIAQGFDIGNGSQQTKAVGDNVTFATTAANAVGTVTYKWFWAPKHGRPYTEIDPAINPTAATASLVNSSLTLASAGVYVCHATDADGSKARAVFDLTVTP